MGLNVLRTADMIQINRRLHISGKARPRMDNATFNSGWNGFNVSPHKISKLRMNLVGVPTGEMQNAHDCKMRFKRHSSNS